jgi:AcrR family transcriptional regulator
VAGYVRAAERREQLLDAAVQVLVSHGLADLTLRAVAAQAGVRLSTLQYIFPSRSELVAALVQRALPGFEDEHFVVGTGGLAIELRRLIEWYVSFATDPAIVELARYELSTRITRDTARETLGGSGRRPLTAEHGQRGMAEIAMAAQEEYDLPTADLSRLFALAHLGVMLEFLEHGDAHRYRADAMFVVDRIVQVARPRPKPSNQRDAPAQD